MQTRRTAPKGCSRLLLWEPCGAPRLRSRPIRQSILCQSSGKSSSRAQVDPTYAAPEVGWMWDTNKKAAATKASLQSANIKAKKSLGQNFCTDDTILQNIIRAAGVKRGDLVVEVGPGTGNLTRHLLATGAQLLAVEKDDTLFERLQQEFGQVPNMHLVHGDVMRLNLDQLLADMVAQERHPAADSAADSEASVLTGDSSSSSSSSSSAAGSAGPTHVGSAGGEDPQPASTSTNLSDGASSRPRRQLRRAKVVANLPYNITKDFLKWLLPRGDVLSELSIMIQEEVAQRLVSSSPGQRNYRAMNVFTQFYSQATYRFKIPKEKYFPVPGVDGALVTFKLRPQGKRIQVSDERRFMSLVSQAFSERRKMLRNNLAPTYTPAQVEEALVQCGLRADARAQDLTLEQFSELYQQLRQ